MSRRQAFYDGLDEFRTCPVTTDELLLETEWAAEEARWRQKDRTSMPTQGSSRLAGNTTAMFADARRVVARTKQQAGRVGNFLTSDRGSPLLTAGVVLGLPAVTALLGDAQYALTVARIAAVILGPVEIIRSYTLTNN